VIDRPLAADQDVGAPVAGDPDAALAAVPSDVLRLVSVAQSSPGVFRIKFSDGHEAAFRAEDIVAEAALAPTCTVAPPSVHMMMLLPGHVASTTLRSQLTSA